MKNKKQYYRIHLRWTDYIDVFTNSKEKAIKKAQKNFKKEKPSSIHLEFEKTMDKKDLKDN